MAHTFIFTFTTANSKSGKLCVMTDLKKDNE